MNPTPFGEGKTTMSIALADGLRRLGKKSCLALREPSLGPVFGIKGGACGGGYAQVVPMEDINLHFNGDFHAITSANNLLSALIDNHIMQGNRLDIQEVVWRRCIDLNDRALRNVEVAVGGGTNGIPRKDGFTITAASEIMAILCLSDSLNDLKNRLDRIVIGYNSKGEEIHAADLKASGAMAALLKEAIKPNLVQTLEGTPAFIHGGPFANIAHGCNSVIATKTALSRSEYTVTEAGFGAELGGEKFINIKCRLSGLKPSCCVLVATARSIKYNAGIAVDEAKTENLEAVQKGFCNIAKHIDNLRKLGQNIVVAVNKFYTDTQAELDLIKALCAEKGIKACIVTAFTDGSNGAVALAEEVIKEAEKPSQINFTYENEDKIQDKIEKIVKNIYGAKNVIYSEEAKKQLDKIEENEKYRSFPVCIAKTQYSFSADATNLGAPSGFDFEVRELLVRGGAGFIVAVCGKILLMPGLSASPNAERISIDGDGNISGLM